MGGKLEKRVAYNYNTQSAYIMSAKGELYNLVELLGNAGITVTTSSLINIARCGDSHIGMRIESLIDVARCGSSRIGMRIENAPNFEGDVIEEVIEAREFLGEVYENLKERLDTLYKELYVKVEEVKRLRNPVIADIINEQDEVRNLQDLNRTYMSNLREDMQNINYEADATNLDLDMRLLMLEMERM